jgi:hypothetical protein
MISPAEIQILLSRAGLVLNPGQVADLVLAWRQVAGLIADMKRDRPLADDLALTFRLPPPAAPPRARDETPERTKPKPKAKARTGTARRAAPRR